MSDPSTGLLRNIREGKYHGGRRPSAWNAALHAVPQGEEVGIESEDPIGSVSDDVENEYVSDASLSTDGESDEDPAADPRGLFSESRSEVEADAGAGGEGQGRPDPIPQKAVCLPLYAKLAPGEQRRAFEAAEALPADCIPMDCLRTA